MSAKRLDAWGGLRLQLKSSDSDELDKSAMISYCAHRSAQCQEGSEVPASLLQQLKHNLVTRQVSSGIALLESIRTCLPPLVRGSGMRPRLSGAWRSGSISATAIPA